MDQHNPDRSAASFELSRMAGQLTSLYERLQGIENRVEAQSQRIQQMEAHHVGYAQSVASLRTHFDGELAEIKATHKALTAAVADVRMMLVRINTLLREDDNGLSLLGWRRMTESWITDHAALHRLHQERTWKVGLDVASKVVLWLLAAFIVAMAARMGFGGKL